MAFTGATLTEAVISLPLPARVKSKELCQAVLSVMLALLPTQLLSLLLYVQMADAHLVH